MRSRLWLCLVLAPLAASAQTTTTPKLTLTINSVRAGYANASECTQPQTVRYTVEVTTACSPLQVWLSTSVCDKRPGATDTVVGSKTESEIAADPDGLLQFEAADLPLEGGCGAAIEKDFNVCGSFQYLTNIVSCTADSPFVTPTEPPTFRYDAVPPPAPVVTSVNTLDGALSPQLDLSDDTTAVGLRFRKQGSTTWITTSNIFVGDKIQIVGLENGVTYEVQAKALDGAGNESPYSESNTGTPEELLGFWDNYQNSGGQSQGCSCTQAAGTPLWLMLAWPALISWWRRRQ